MDAGWLNGYVMHNDISSSDIIRTGWGGPLSHFMPTLSMNHLSQYLLLQSAVGKKILSLLDALTSADIKR